MPPVDRGNYLECSISTLNIVSIWLASSPVLANRKLMVLSALRL